MNNFTKKVSKYKRQIGKPGMLIARMKTLLVNDSSSPQINCRHSHTHMNTYNPSYTPHTHSRSHTLAHSNSSQRFIKYGNTFLHADEKNSNRHCKKEF